LEETKSLCAQKNHSNVILKTSCFDVRDVSAFEKTVQELPRLDVLYNNAGIGEEPFAYPTDMSANEMQRIIDIDLTSVITGTAIGIQAIRKHGGGGAIVNTASMAALVPTPGTSIYAAAKGGVAHFTRSMYYLHRSEDIRVVGICPSFTETPMALSLGPERVEAMKEEVGGLLEPIEVVTGMIELVEQAAGGSLMRVTVRGGRDYWPKIRSKL